MASNMLFKRTNKKEVFSSVRSNLATELSDVTLVCEDGKRMEAQSRLLSLFSPLIRSIVNNSNHLLILPDFPLHAVNEVVNLLKGKAGEEEVVKLTKQQVDLLNCLGVPLPTLDKVVAGKRDVDLLVCELCDQKVVDAEWNILYEKLDRIAASGAKIVLSKLPIGDVATQYFSDREMFCAGRVVEEDLNRYINNFHQQSTHQIPI